SAQVVTPFVQVGTSRESSVSGGADYPFTLVINDQGPASDHVHRFGLSQERDLMSMFRTISRYGVNSEERLPTGLPSRCYGVLEAPHTRRASPLLAGLSAGITPSVGQFDYPTRNFARRLIRTCPFRTRRERSSTSFECRSL